MAKLLFVHIRYPQFDRCAGDLRFANMLRILAGLHEVALHVLYQPEDYLQREQNRPYRKFFDELKIEVRGGDLARHLRNQCYDAVIIEFWSVAGPILEMVRVLQPQARVIVDTEHIYFYSAQLRESALGYRAGALFSSQKKLEELAVYAAADAIITTSDEDGKVVERENPAVVWRTVPIIHELPAAPVGELSGRRPDSIVFVGSFAKNPANVDAMLWFCSDVLPLIRSRLPSVHLTIVGNEPPPKVKALAGVGVEVTGYVPDTAPYLDSSVVSICPLRFGAGLKGKVGEAMSRGVPVVATSVGTQGMQVEPGREILVADSAADFASAVVRLLQEPFLWREVSWASRAFLERNFSFAAVERQLEHIFRNLNSIPIKRLSPWVRLYRRGEAAIGGMLRERVLWRLRRKSQQ